MTIFKYLGMLFIGIILGVLYNQEIKTDNNKASPQKEEKLTTTSQNKIENRIDKKKEFDKSKIKSSNNSSNNLNFGGNNLIHYVANSKYVNINVLKQLITEGFDINIKNEDGASAFLLSIPNLDTFEDFKELLRLNVDLSIIDNYGNSVLSMALLNKNKETKKKIIDYLLENGLSFKKNDLFLASIKGNEKYAEEILHLIDENYQEYFYQLVQSGGLNDDRLSFFIDKIDLYNPSTINGLFSSKDVSIKVINELYKKGINISERDNINYTPLMYSILNADIEKINFLLTKDVDVNFEEINNMLTQTKVGRYMKTEDKKKVIDILNQHKKNNL